MTEELNLTEGWGKTRRSQKVHFYHDGHTFCGLSHRMDISFPEWNPQEPETCNKCREWHKWVSKGGVILSRPYTLWHDLQKSTQT